MARGFCYPPGILYDGFLEPLLRKIRRNIRILILRDRLFPVLDLCCGPGAQVRWLAWQGEISCGLDINLGMLKYAAGRSPNGLFVCADAVQTPFPPASFKAIIVSFALHEKRALIRPRLLTEAKRLLLPNGRIILVDFERPWNIVSRLANFYIWIIERLAGRDHFRNGREFLAKGGLRALLRENGLREVDRHDIAAGSCALVLAVRREFDHDPRRITPSAGRITLAGG